jgi:hypothetical protein
MESKSSLLHGSNAFMKQILYIYNHGLEKLGTNWRTKTHLSCRVIAGELCAVENHL